MPDAKQQGNAQAQQRRMVKRGWCHWCERGGAYLVVEVAVEMVNSEKGQAIFMLGGEAWSVQDNEPGGLHA